MTQQVFRHTAECDFSSRETEIRLEGSDPGTRGLGKAYHGMAWPTSSRADRCPRGEEMRGDEVIQGRAGRDKTEQCTRGEARRGERKRGWLLFG